MSEDLDAIRKQHRVDMKTAVQVMEEQLYYRTKMLSLQFLNGRTIFTVKRGFANTVMVAELLIFMDGNLIYARKNVVVDKEVTFNINMRYSNLPLRDGKKVSVIIRDVKENINILDEYNLFMMNNEEGYLLPISGSTYKVM